MKNILVLIILLSISHQAFSQLYHSNKRSTEYFVEIKNDTAHIEIFLAFKAYYIRKINDELLPLNNLESDTIYIGTEANILKKRSNYYLLYKAKEGRKTRKIKLKICEYDNRRFLRNESYGMEKSFYISRLQDSLSGPDTRICVNHHGYSLHHDDSLSESEFIRAVDKTMDTLKQIILRQKNPIVDDYYRKANAITELDTSEIFELLSKAN